MDWSTRACARTGHVTFSPDEPHLAEQIRVNTPAGIAWKCLRCGVFVPGDPFAYGPGNEAPEILHDHQIRDRVIIRFLAVERFIRGLIVLVLGIIVYQLQGSQDSLQDRLTTSIPLLKPFADQIGWNINQSKFIHLLNVIVETTPHTLVLIAMGLVAYGCVQLTEGVGLWYQLRWAEYLTVVATSAFIPYEIYELMHTVTLFKIGAFVLNILAVLWLLWTKHLFGVNGGGAAIEVESLRGLSAIDHAISLRHAPVA